MQELEQEMLSIVFKQRREGSLRETLNRLRRVASLVRNRLSVDTWRILSQLHQDVARAKPGRVQLSDALVLLNHMVMGLAAFSGMEMENMTRGHGWRFLEVGRRLERSINLVSLLRVALGEPAAALPPLLEIADSSMTYRRRYFTNLQLAPVLDLLLADEGNPRSLAFQLVALTEHVENLPRMPDCPAPSREQKIMATLLASLRNADSHALGRARESGAPGQLDDLLNHFAEELEALSDTISHYYFSHARPRVS